MVRVPEAMRQQVREHAAGRCEYCLIHDEDSLRPHQADHIIAEKHGGPMVVTNLAWACGICNRYKGSDLSAIDPLSGKIVPLFNPSIQRWQRHFRLVGSRIQPLTAAGRVTARLLRLNDRAHVLERGQLIALGRYPRE